MRKQSEKLNFWTLIVEMKNFIVSFIVSQLDKCLKFKSIRGDKNDRTLYKITPRNAINYSHLSSCCTIVFVLNTFNSIPKMLTFDLSWLQIYLRPGKVSFGTVKTFGCWLAN